MPAKSRRFRLSALTLGTVAAVATSLVATTGTTLAATSRVQPVVAGSPYLSLGDSIVFGYRESNNTPAPDYSNPANFKGYPEYIAAALGLDLTNASCPGETTSSMIDKTAASNGCENSYDDASGQQVPVGYRKAYPLHTSYKRSQLGFAKLFLKRHPNTRLVTLTIGANDGFLCQKQTSDGCISEFGDLQTKLKKNLGTIFKGIRGTGYTGQIVLLNYYSYNYTDNFLTAEIQLLNSALADGAKGYHVRIASAFDAFKAATEQNGGDTCAAQLITVLTDGSSPCGVHPSIQGQTLLAQTVMARAKK
jgi:lysophospholipase L1-like esterase